MTVKTFDEVQVSENGVLETKEQVAPTASTPSVSVQISTEINRRENVRNHKNHPQRSGGGKGHCEDFEQNQEFAIRTDILKDEIHPLKKHLELFKAELRKRIEKEPTKIDQSRLEEIVGLQKMLEDKSIKTRVVEEKIRNFLMKEVKKTKWWDGNLSLSQIIANERKVPVLLLKRKGKIFGEVFLATNPTRAICYFAYSADPTGDVARSKNQRPDPWKSINWLEDFPLMSMIFTIPGRVNQGMYDAIELKKIEINRMGNELDELKKANPESISKEKVEAFTRASIELNKMQVDLGRAEKESQMHSPWDLGLRKGNYNSLVEIINAKIDSAYHPYNQHLSEAQAYNFIQRSANFVDEFGIRWMKQNGSETITAIDENGKFLPKELGTNVIGTGSIRRIESKNPGRPDSLFSWVTPNPLVITSETTGWNITIKAGGQAALKIANS